MGTTTGSRQAAAGRAGVPDGVRTLSDLSAGLERMRSAYGVSYRELQRRVSRLRRPGGGAVVAYDTVYRCLQPGRRRLDVDLVADIAVALTGEPDDGHAWRRAYELVVGEIGDAHLVEVTTELAPARPAFVGRGDELRRLTRLPDGPAIVRLIDGMPGAGKTWLAHRAAREVAERLRPDFVASVDLRGHDRERAPADPGAVLGELLRLLAVPARRFAGLGTAERSRLFRDRLSDRRAVLVLDNAGDDDQVRPLLPGTPGSVVFVTSRGHLRRLPGSRQPIGVLPVRDSIEVLRRLIPSGPADVPVLTRLTEAAAQLPLALALIGSRVRDHPEWTLSDHADRFVEAARVLRIEQGVELAVDLSYRTLDRPARAMLRALSLHPGRRIDTGAAAALANLSIERATEQLDALLAANLVGSAAGNRVEVHDLVRIFATGRALDEDPPPRRAEAGVRLATYYTATAAHAIELWSAGVDALPTTGCRSARSSAGVVLAQLDTAEQALAWLDSERGTMTALALGDQPCASGPTGLMLAETLAPYFWTNGHYREAELVFARGASQADGARSGRLLMRLAGVRWSLGLYEQAAADALAAVRNGRAAGDDALLAGALMNLGLIRHSELRSTEAERLLLQALEIGDRTDDLRLRALVRTNLGNLRRDQGRTAEAITWYRRTLDVATPAKTGLEAVAARACLAEALEELDEPGEAHREMTQVLAEARTNGAVAVEVRALTQLARLAGRSGSFPEALALTLTALRLARAHHLVEPIAGLQQFLAETRRLRRAAEAGQLVDGRS